MVISYQTKIRHRVKILVVSTRTGENHSDPEGSAKEMHLACLKTHTMNNSVSKQQDHVCFIIKHPWGTFKDREFDFMIHKSVFVSPWLINDSM